MNTKDRKYSFQEYLHGHVVVVGPMVAQEWGVFAKSRFGMEFCILQSESGGERVQECDISSKCTVNMIRCINAESIIAISTKQNKTRAQRKWNTRFE